MIAPKQKEPYFLATTALEKFWDTTKPIIFLGEWCRLYERRQFWQNIEHKLMTAPYQSQKDAEEAFFFVNKVYEHVLPILASALNDIHGVNYTVRAWRILIGPWLQYYLSAIYDRYTHIKQAIALYPNFTTITLAPNLFVVPQDTLESVSLLSDDFYNLQILTKILATFGNTYPERTIYRADNFLYKNLTKLSLHRKIIGDITQFYEKICSSCFSVIHLKNTYFPKKIELNLAVRNFGQLLPMWEKAFTNVSSAYDADKRKLLQSLNFGAGEFEKCVAKMLFSDIPKCFVEQFTPAYLTKKPPVAILSANAWYFDEKFKHWAAVAAEQGTLLLGAQHGGSYGGLALMLAEMHEATIVDIYYSWGWDKPNSLTKVVAMPATKLIGRKKIGADNRKNDVLWAATFYGRYLVEFPYLSTRDYAYCLWQKRFAESLTKNKLEQIRFRPHFASFGTGGVERLLAFAPNIVVESWDTPFQKSLINCRLYVCDHLSTTFAEALSANKPTILFWDPELNKLRPEAQFYYDALRKVGILFDTPEAAAFAVNNIYDDVETWWNQSVRQEAVKLFCHQFARTSPDAVKLWDQELKSIVSSAPCSSL